MVFTGTANTTSTSIGMEAVVWWKLTKWWEKAMVTLKTVKRHPLVPFSALHIKQLNPWANTLASYVEIITDCLLVKGRWSHLKTTWEFVDIWQASETSYSKRNLVNIQYQYLPELLSNVHSYSVMVKVCLTVVCMEPGFSQIHSHINYCIDWPNMNL